MTGDPELSKKYQKHIPGQDDTYWIVFSIPMGTHEEKVKLDFIQTNPTL